MHLENSSCTNHTDDLKISTWHTQLLHCALSQKIKVGWKKWILKDYWSIALFIWRNLNHDMEAVAHIPLQRKWKAFNKSICTSLANFYRVHYSPVDFIEWKKLCKLMWKFYVLFSIRTNFAEHGEKSYL